VAAAWRPCDADGPSRAGGGGADLVGEQDGAESGGSANSDARTWPASGGTAGASIELPPVL